MSRQFDVNEHRRKPQKHRLLFYLAKNQYITNKEARDLLKIERGSTEVVEKLRKDGYFIDTYLDCTGKAVYSLGSPAPANCELFVLMTKNGIKYGNEITEDDLFERGLSGVKVKKRKVAS